MMEEGIDVTGIPGPNPMLGCGMILLVDRLNCCKCDCCIFRHDNLWAESYVACRLCDPKGFF